MESSSTLPNMPEKFPSIMMDFVEDLNHTFPEYKSSWWIYSKDTTPAGWVDLYHYCLKVYPERFFDILYQNDELFSQESTHNTFFLPNVDFRKLFLTEGVSESTKSSLWKYLQLILFTIVGDVKDKGQFGDAENIFKGVNDEELQSKIAEAVQGLGEFFQSIGSDDNTENNEDAFSGFEHINSEEAQEAMSDLFTKMEQTMNEAMDESTAHESQNEQTQEESNTKDSTNGASSSSHMPNADDLHSHLQGLFDGKIGSLAEELMEELGGDIKDTFGIDPDDDNENVGPMDILKKLMRNPDKMMKIVKKVQGKFQEKMSSGDLSQEDLMKEAGDMLRKMKEMGGSSQQMHEMFQNMAKSMGGMGGGKNMRMDTAKLDRMMKGQDTRERMLAKLEKRREEERLAKEAVEQKEPHVFKYRPQGAEEPERSKLSDAQLADLSKEFDEDIANTAQEKKTKSKSKSKKGKKAKK